MTDFAPHTHTSMVESHATMDDSSSDEEDVQWEAKPPAPAPPLAPAPTSSYPAQNALQHSVALSGAHQGPSHLASSASSSIPPQPHYAQHHPGGGVPPPAPGATVVPQPPPPGPNGAPAPHSHAFAGMPPVSSSSSGGRSVLSGVPHTSIANGTSMPPPHGINGQQVASSNVAPVHPHMPVAVAAGATAAAAGAADDDGDSSSDDEGDDLVWEQPAAKRVKTEEPGTGLPIKQEPSSHAPPPTAAGGAFVKQEPMPSGAGPPPPPPPGSVMLPPPNSFQFDQKPSVDSPPPPPPPGAPPPPPMAGGQPAYGVKHEPGVKLEQNAYPPQPYGVKSEYGVKAEFGVKPEFHSNGVVQASVAPYKRRKPPRYSRHLIAKLSVERPPRSRRPWEVPPIIKTVIAQVGLGTELNLRAVAQKSQNVAYSAQRNSSHALMRMIKPVTAAVTIYQSGMLSVMGQPTPTLAKIVLRKAARKLQKVVPEIRFADFRLSSVTGSASCPFEVHLEELGENEVDAFYDSELSMNSATSHANYSMDDLNVELKIYHTGTVQCSAKSRENFYEAFERFFPIVAKYAKDLVLAR